MSGVKQAYLPGGAKVAPIPAAQLEDSTFTAYHVCERCVDGQGNLDGTTGDRTVSGTSPVHAAYRYLWKHRGPFVGTIELQVAELLSSGRQGRVWVLDVEHVPVVLSSRLVAGRGKKRKK